MFDVNLKTIIFFLQNEIMKTASQSFYKKFKKPYKYSASVMCMFLKFTIGIKNSMYLYISIRLQSIVFSLFLFHTHKIINFKYTFFFQITLLVTVQTGLNHN